MSHRDAPPLTLKQEECMRWWLERKGPGWIGWGQAKDGSFLSRMAQDVYAAWEAAQGGDVEHAHAMGFRRAALWAERDDLICDIDSQAYERDRAIDLEALRATPSDGDKLAKAIGDGV